MSITITIIGFFLLFFTNTLLILPSNGQQLPEQYKEPVAKLEKFIESVLNPVKTAISCEENIVNKATIFQKTLCGTVNKMQEYHKNLAGNLPHKNMERDAIALIENTFFNVKNSLSKALPEMLVRKIPGYNDSEDENESEDMKKQQFQINLGTLKELQSEGDYSSEQAKLLAYECVYNGRKIAKAHIGKDDHVRGLRWAMQQFTVDLLAYKMEIPELRHIPVEWELYGTGIAELIPANLSHNLSKSMREDYARLAKKVHEFATSQPLAKLKNNVCFNDQQKDVGECEGEVLYKQMLCNTVQKLVKIFKQMGMEQTNDRKSLQTGISQQHLSISDGVEKLREAVKNFLVKLREEVVVSRGIRGGAVQQKAETHDEFKALNEQFLSNLKELKKLMKRSFLLQSVNFYVHNCLILLEAMDATLVAHPGFGPEHKLPLAMTEFGIILWVLTALQVHPILGQIAEEANKWIIFK